MCLFGDCEDVHAEQRGDATTQKCDVMSSFHLQNPEERGCFRAGKPEQRKELELELVCVRTDDNYDHHDETTAEKCVCFFSLMVPQNP